MISMMVCSIMADSDGEQGQSWDDRTQQDVVGRQIAPFQGTFGESEAKKAVTTVHNSRSP